MTKEHWQAMTFVLAGLCAMSLAAAYYNRAELRRITTLLQQAEKSAAEPAPIERQVIYTRMPQTEPERSTPGKNQRCINGTLFEKVGNELKNIGQC